MGEDKEFLESILKDYFAECDEHLLSIKRNILALESYIGEEKIDDKVVNELFRSFHTIKGLSAMVGISPAEKLSHDLESYLKLLKSGKKTLEDKDFSILKEGVKYLEEVILNTKENKEIPDLSIIIDRLKLLLLESSTQKEEEKKNKNIKIEKDLEDIISLKTKEGKNIYQVMFYPSQELSEKGISVEYIKEKLSYVSEILKVSPKIDEAKKVYFEFFIACEDKEKLNFLSEINVNFNLVREKLTLKEEQREKPSITSSLPSSFIRVDLSKLDELMRILGELVIAKSKLQNKLKDIETYLPPQLFKDFSEANRGLERHLKDLRESLMRIRLIPIGEALERMQFVIRDLIRESNKRINLHISGKETEIDKYIVERIIEPLLHLVRNAISHGIEGEEERVKKGKDPTGNIYLRAYTEGEEVVIEVENDGRPIDPDKIAKRALNLGLIKDKSEVNSEEKILEIICSPDFSTRDEADRASGRGVGMAVVKNTIRELGGKLLLRSDEKSTCFTLKLPLTLAILDTIIVEVSSEKYAIPLSSVKEIMEIKNEDIFDFRNMKFISYREKSLPLIFLSDIFNLQKENKDKYFVLVVIRENKEWGIIVDKLVNIREAVIRPINDPIILKNPSISGATDFGDGKVVLILNIDGVLKGGLKYHV